MYINTLVLLDISCCLLYCSIAKTKIWYSWGAIEVMQWRHKTLAYLATVARSPCWVAKTIHVERDLYEFESGSSAISTIYSSYFYQLEEATKQQYIEKLDKPLSTSNTVGILFKLNYGATVEKQRREKWSVLITANVQLNGYICHVYILLDYLKVNGTVQSAEERY